MKMQKPAYEQPAVSSHTEAELMKLTEACCATSAGGAGGGD